MQILRIKNIKIIDIANIEVKFTDTLTTNLVNSNIIISSNLDNVPSPNILQIKISGDTLSINCQPLTSLASYYVEFKSIPLHSFESLNGTSKISEDGVSNKILFVAPLNPDNEIKSYLDTFLHDNIYDEDNDNTIIKKYIKSLSVILSKALHDIRQVKNENYLNFNVIDEVKTRGAGPSDRLNEEGAYEIIRVGRTATGANTKATFSYDLFPYYPVTLQRQDNIETFTANSIDVAGIFNINSLVFNFSNAPITKINQITFTFNTATPVYIYNISELGYQLKDSRYDQEFGFSYLQLNDNQIRINDKVLEDPLFALNNIISISVTYETKNLGIIIDDTSVEIYSSMDSIREVLPPIVNIFSLAHFPIIDIGNNIPTLSGIIFQDPNSGNGSAHPAFISEIPFRLNGLPSIPGQYSIDYTTGTVYVYGKDRFNDGTGPYPPLATYKYKFTYKSELDYVYDNDLRDIVALPNGNLINQIGNISFNFEEVLIPGTDYNADLHKEILNERIGNKLLSLNSLKSTQSPITNIFKIFNETSGEIYSLDRWNDNKIYFKYNTPPKIIEQINERASLTTVNNELLLVNTSITNASNLKIFKILLNNNNIAASTEDALGSSFNSSVFFSDGYVFASEKWFNRDFTESQNLNRLQNVGEYMIDYIHGIIYVSVSSTQGFGIGTTTYKNSLISTQFPHIVSVEDLYYRISPLNPKNKLFSYTDFTDTTITPESLDPSDELFLNSSDTAPYQLHLNNVGIFVGTSFSEGVTNEVKFVRGIFEYQDILNSTNPINFAPVSTSSEFNISVNAMAKNEFGIVEKDIDGYFVTINENIPYLSPNITKTFSVIRLSDGYDLWNISGTVMPGNPVKLILSGIHSPNIGDQVNITYTFTINDLSRLVIDYNKGDYFTDYTYLNDEIIISYEYGDNILDFRNNTNLPEGSDYFASYKVGALRDSLLKNFGTLVNVSELSVFDVDFNRERYRDALIAALSSFVQGPTLTAIKNIVSTISHIEPEIIESAFLNWSLGSSLLNPQSIQTTGTFELLPAKYNNGVLIDSNDQTITFPINSNLRLEEGTFETWVIPQWNGLDNQSDLLFNITKDGASVLPNDIFIGVSEYHPTITNGEFSLNKNASVFGTPNTNKDGVFIYYDKDISGNFDRWYVRVLDGYVDGYSASSRYKVKVTSTGSFYDSKSITLPKSSNLTIFTGTNAITFDGYKAPSSIMDLGITFLSDKDHYLLDFGENKSKNRFSVYKDASGYLNFRIFDRDKVSYAVSADVSSWKIGELHHVGISWKLNTLNSKDEMHLFLDGFEVPNIIKYGQKLAPYLNEAFRTVDPEEIVGSATRDIISSIDLHTTSGSMIVTSSINFSAYNIFIGDTIFIDELGFSSTGYSITNISGQTLTLNSAMPVTLTNARFSINRTSFMVDSAIDVASNFYVSTIHSLSTTENEIPGLRAVRPSYSVEKDGYFNNILTISNNVFAGDLILIRTLGLNNRGIKAKHYIWGDNQENILMTRLPLPISLDEAKITKIILPATVVDGYHAYSSTFLSGIFDGYFSVDPVSNSNFGRTISVNISGTNADFSTPTTVIINGLVGASTVNETITFNNYGDGYTTNKFISINNIRVITKPINPLKNAVSIIVKEKYSMTIGEEDAFSAIIRYSYVIGSGTTLKDDGYGQVRDENFLFSGLDSTNYLLISSPVSVAGYYIVTGFSADRKSLTIMPTNTSMSLPLASFTDGYYQILNISDYRSGLQNGFFTLEIKSLPSQEFYLRKGFYELEYSSYTKIKLDITSNKMFIGSDFNGENQLNGIVDQIKIYSTMLTDTRVGEEIPANQRSITKDFNSIKELKADTQTLMLIDFNEFPFTNLAKFYINSNKDKRHFQSADVINENFGNSIVILDKPIIVSNDGILDTKKQGTIEFWVNPLFDTSNDPNTRFYFDAFGAVIEEATSINSTSVKLSAPASRILNIKLKNGDPNIDYFAGGKLEIDTQNAIQEQVSRTSNSIVTVSKFILQVISVKIIGDLSGIDYFAGGSVGSDLKTIYLANTLPTGSQDLIVTYQTTENNKFLQNTQIIRLNRKLPYQNSNVVVNYIPQGLQGDRICIFKDPVGYMNFAVTASGTDYVIRAAIRWSKNTWHRVKATYKVNSGKGNDEIKLFVDGYQYADVTFGHNIVLGDLPIIFGTSTPGGADYNDGYGFIENIVFKDPINDLFIGSKYTGQNGIFALLDNLRISNILRPTYAPYGEPLDVNYSTNIDAVFPVTEDLYTTYLMDFDDTIILNEDFAILKNRKTGIFDFSVNVIDSLDIVSSNIKSKEALEKLVKVLKPANSRVFIKYTK